MRNFLVFLLLILSTIGLSQQPAIQGHTLIPANPNSSSQIKIVTHLETLSSAFLVDKTHSVNQSQQYINLHLCYAYGMSPFIATHIDTFAIGQLAPGVYSVDLDAYISSAGQHCARVDSNFASFTYTVAGGTNLQETNGNKVMRLFPNPAQNLITLEGETSAIVNVYTLQAQLISSFKPSAKGEISVEDLKPGMYFFEIVTTDKRSVHRIIID